MVYCSKKIENFHQQKKIPRSFIDMRVKIMVLNTQKITYYICKKVKTQKKKKKCNKLTDFWLLIH